MGKAKAQAAYVGIDVAKRTFDSGIITRKEHVVRIDTLTNDESGADALLKLLSECQHTIKLVVLEATGGLETLLVMKLQAAGYKVAVVNPRQVRYFAKARGLLAKTDKLDATVLARFGLKINPPVRPLHDEHMQAFSALLTRRRQLVDNRVAELNRLQQTLPLLQPDVQAHIDWLNEAIDRIDDQLRQQVIDEPQWQERDALLQSVKGVGDITSMTLLAQLPELGQVSHKEIAALAGVAPHANDSGTFKGKRHCWGGRADVRAVLYMATLSAIRHNPVIRQFYQLKRDGGNGQESKPKKVAIVAAMHKLLTILNAILRTMQPWRDPAVAVVA